MEPFEFLIASGLPLISMCAVFILFRKSSLNKLVLLQFLSLVLSTITGIVLISLIMQVDLVHPYHNPGVGVVFALMLMASIICTFVVVFMTIIAIARYFMRRYCN